MEDNRLKDWQKLIETYNDFFYADDGIFTISLLDKELNEYELNFDYIVCLIKELKSFESKYGNLYDDEKKDLLNFKEKLISLDTGTNGIKNAYEKMNSIYNANRDE